MQRSNRLLCVDPFEPFEATQPQAKENAREATCLPRQSAHFIEGTLVITVHASTGKGWEPPLLVVNSVQSFSGFPEAQKIEGGTYLPCFIIKERFFWVFCIWVSSSPLGFHSPRWRTSAAASCTFSQPWKRPRWLSVPTALGKVP